MEDALTALRSRLKRVLNSNLIDEYIKRQSAQDNEYVRDFLTNIRIQSGLSVSSFNQELRSAWDTKGNTRLLMPILNLDGNSFTYTAIRNLQLYHVTTLDGLYNILNSGYLEARNKTGTMAGLAPSTNKNSGDWIYLSLYPGLPTLGRLSVQLVFSFGLLMDRHDYYLNYTWSYGKTNESLGSDQLDRYLANYKAETSEIIFENPIPIDPYLVSINIVQLPQKLLQMMPPGERVIVDPTRIPEKYKKYLNIIETLGNRK